MHRYKHRMFEYKQSFFSLSQCELITFPVLMLNAFSGIVYSFEALKESCLLSLFVIAGIQNAGLPGIQNAGLPYLLSCWGAAVSAYSPSCRRSSLRAALTTSSVSPSMSK